MKSLFLTACGALALSCALLFPSLGQAANFQVDVKRLSITQCSMTGSLLQIDPTTGNVSIELFADATCYPTPIALIASNASISVIGPSTVGGGTTGQGTVNLQLNTGLAGPVTGVTCTPDGGRQQCQRGIRMDFGSVYQLRRYRSHSSGCRADTSGVVNGTITFKAKCTYQDPINANLQTVRSNIRPRKRDSGTGTAPPPSYCVSVSELANARGLTDAMRQPTATISTGLNTGVGIDVLNYTSVFGFANNTFPAGNPDNVGFGFPGSYYADTEFGVQKNKFIAMKFRAPSNSSWLNEVARMRFFIGTAYTQIAIGQCPGQFGTDTNFPVNASCRVAGKGEDLIWNITQAVTGNCQLVPGNTYYLNVINASNMSDLTQSTCSSSSCALVSVIRVSARTSQRWGGFTEWNCQAARIHGAALFRPGLASHGVLSWVEPVQRVRFA